MEKYRSRLISSSLSPHYDSLTEQFCRLLTEKEQNRFCDQLVKKLNGAYRAALTRENTKDISPV